MATAGSKLQLAINSLFQCGFCQEIYQDPRILPCNHTFCLKCLQKQSDITLKSKSNAATCATCHALWVIPDNGVSDLAKNYAAQYCSRYLPSLNKCKNATISVCNKHENVEFFCLTCWFALCKECKEVHRTPWAKDHNVKSTTEISKEDVEEYKKRVILMCTTHNSRKMILFCTDCAQIGCYLCMTESHSMHTCINFN